MGDTSVAFALPFLKDLVDAAYGKHISLMRAGRRFHSTYVYQSSLDVPLR